VTRSKNTAPRIESFGGDAKAYDRYLDGPRGRLRFEAAFEHLSEAFPALRETSELRILDAGGGTGRMAVRLAQLGHRVRLLDPSPHMIDLARGRATAAGAEVGARLSWTLGAIGDPAADVGSGYDLVIAHNVLEYVADPGEAVQALADAGADGGYVSLLCANRLSQPLALARKGGDSASVRAAMGEHRFPTELFGGWRTEFDPRDLATLARDAGLHQLALRGVSVLGVSAASFGATPDEERAWLEIELRVGREEAYLGVARYLQCIARRGARADATPSIGNDGDGRLSGA